MFLFFPALLAGLLCGLLCRMTEKKEGLTMKTAIVGINWGDEGKGRMVDLLCEQYQVVVRYQGGNNAGHTVINPRGKFILNLLPSGILHEDTVNVMGSGMLIDIEHLQHELAALRAAGVTVGPQQLRISHHACICLPYHKQLDILEEERLGDARFGSTRRGIAPGYADKYMKKALRMADLLLPADALAARVRALVEWKNLTVAKGYGAPALQAEEILAWLERYGRPLQPYICDSGACLREAEQAGKNILFEAQLGALRDIDFGIYPYTTSSTTLAAYAPLGAGAPGLRLDHVVGVIKAYSSCVGEGPFVVELQDEAAERLRAAGAEYGAATGRPRRVGAFDLVASRYGVQMQGADALALTKLDVLAYLERIPVCVAYRIDGMLRKDFPSCAEQLRAEPVYQYLEGFGCDISACRRWEELPAAAQRYVEFIEQQLDCPIRYVSVGAEREQIVLR